MCNSCCRECRRKVYINTVAFTDGSLVLTLPDNISYSNCGKYCFVITTDIPDTVTINAPVVAVVGDGTTQFPVLDRCGAQVVAQQINNRCRYPFRVSTSAAGGTITILSKLPCVQVTTLAALNDAEGGAGA